MDNQIRHTLPKKERLCGKTGISKLLADGKHGNIPGFRFCYLSGNQMEYNRIMVSVPKKIFKRAVKRNLLKRRIRESWRLQKESLNATGVDILFTYSTKEILKFEDIQAAVAKIIEKINKGTAYKISDNGTTEQI
jgi:ribonuclease P protein component